MVDALLFFILHPTQYKLMHLKGNNTYSASAKESRLTSITATTSGDTIVQPNVSVRCVHTIYSSVSDIGGIYNRPQQEHTSMPMQIKHSYL